MQTRQTRTTNVAGASAPNASSGRGRYRLGVGGLEDRHYLWILVGLEVGALYVLRHGFRRYHGG